MRSGHEYIIVVMRESESEWVMSETKKLCLVMSLIAVSLDMSSTATYV
jgi:hypothetical protein